MFNWLSYRLRLYKLNFQQWKYDREAGRQFKLGKKKNDPEFADNWYDSVGHYEYEELAWKRKALVSHSLISEADSLHLPRPQYNDKEKWDSNCPEHVERTLALTPEAMTELRTTIRKEKRERRETVEWWVKIIGGLITIGTGLVGALIGLVSVWKHK